MKASKETKDPTRVNPHMKKAWGPARNRFEAVKIDVFKTEADILMDDTHEKQEILKPTGIIGIQKCLIEPPIAAWSMIHSTEWLGMTKRNVCFFRWDLICPC